MSVALIPDGTYTIINLLTNSCLEPENGVKTKGQLLVGGPANPWKYQRWTVTYDTIKAAYTLQNVSSSQYASTTQTQITEPSTYQTLPQPSYFTIQTGTESGAFFIYQTDDPTKLFDLKGGDPSLNTPVIFYEQNVPLTSTYNQQWRFAIATPLPTD